MIRGSNRVISNQKPTASFGIHNRFDIEVIDAETGKLKQEAKAYNVICNQLWTRWAAKQTYFAYIQYGSGNGTPSATDTQLFNYVGEQQATNETPSIDYKNGVFSLRKQIQLAAGTAVGVTITEVGIAYYTGKTTLCTHAMLQDMNGNRVSIAKTATDVVNIYATVYVHFNPNGYNGGHIRLGGCVLTRSLFAVLCGHSTEYPNRMYHTHTDTANMYDGWYGGYPSDIENSNDFLSVTTTCNAENKTITITPARIESSMWNGGGLRYIGFWTFASGGGSNLYEPWCFLRPGGSWFPYSQITAEAVGTGDGSTVDYSLEFPFVYDMKVYIDGIETTDFTYDHAPNTATNMYTYMQMLHPDSTPDNHIDIVYGSYNPHVPARILYNPAYALGISAVKSYTSTEICASNDLKTWHVIQPITAPANSTGSTITTNVPSEYANYKYWKGTNTVTSTLKYKIPDFIPPSTFTGKTLHFNTPPAAGAVITADYKTDTIAKDANHVFDCSVTIQLGEYTGD